MGSMGQGPFQPGPEGCVGVYQYGSGKGDGEGKTGKEIRMMTGVGMTKHCM